MKWVEHVVLGAMGGAVGTMGIMLVAVEGSLMERLSTSLSAYTTFPELVISSLLFGWVGGRISEASSGAFLGGAAGPLVIVALRLIF